VGIELTEVLAWHRAEGLDYQRMRSLVDDPDHGAEGDLELRALKRILHWVSQPTKDSTGEPCGFRAAEASLRQRGFVVTVAGNGEGDSRRCGPRFPT
jgi:hypothetical protein